MSNTKYYEFYGLTHDPFPKNAIDLEKYVRKIKEKPVYEVAFDLLLERYVYSTNKHKKGIIMLESRGKEDDKELLKHINEIINIKGTKGIKSKELKDKIDIQADILAPTGDNAEVNDAILGLESLGYKRSEAAEAVRKVAKEGMNAEEILKRSLLNLSR